jgi:hypothetical protein
LFVWTVKPEASARLLAAMYGNAAILAAIGLTRRSWPLLRATFVVFTLFSVAATIVTFFHLDPFLAHPRYVFAYWLVNYFFLCATTPLLFATRERAFGGRLAVASQLNRAACAAAALAGLACLVAGLALLVGPQLVNPVWPWQLTPLVARISGVWLTAIAAAFFWSLWDGDAARTRPIFQQGLPTAILIGLVPLADRGHLGSGPAHYVLYGTLTGTLALAGIASPLQRDATVPSSESNASG